MKHHKRNHSALSAAILGWLLLTASAVQAGHPLVTDDAGTASPI